MSSQPTAGNGTAGNDTAGNEAAVAAIRAHHAELASQLHRRTGAVLAAAGTGADCAAERAALHDWYRTELIPHIVAEERSLYATASDLPATGLLVRGMLAEHQALAGLVADLGLAQTGFAAATAASAAHALFTVHLGKENDLLLPALDEAGVDLAGLLAGMHDILGAAADSDGGCGCGCAHDEPAPAPVTFLAAPPAQPADPGALAARDGELDVRVLPHGQRHEIIFARLDALGPGEELVIVNDHDPKPLRYQASALWPDRFDWTYRDAGPQVWRVAISRAG